MEYQKKNHKTPQKNNSETVTNENNKEIPISPEERQKIIDKLELI